MQNILITGCNGLIGAALVERLRKEVMLNVFGVGRSEEDLQNGIKIDLSTDWNTNLLPEKLDVIIHLAQSEKFRNFPESAEEVFKINTQSTLRLLEYARHVGVKKFIYASSGGVYGNSNIGFNEESPLQLNKDLGFYLTTKFCSELIVENYKSFFDINILRFFFVFGERQRKNMLIPRLVETIRNNKPVTLQGNDGIKINPIYVDDAANAITKIMGEPGSFNVNIGGNEIISIKRISEIIAKELNVVPVFEYQDTEAKNLIGDISKMKKFYTPGISFEDAIKKMI